MWVAKIKFSGKETLIGAKAQEFNVDLFGFPLSYIPLGKWITVHIAGTIIGEEENVKNFVKSLKKESRVKEFEVNNNFFIGVIKDPSYLSQAYNKEIIHLSPTMISSKGNEITTIGSFNRNILQEAIKILEKKFQGELLSIENKKINSISIIRQHPNLTDKQKRAINIAIKMGYYEIPRRTSVKKLAKTIGLSFSTFQAHLRKAESKLIPYSFEQDS